MCPQPWTDMEIVALADLHNDVQSNIYDLPN